MQNTAPNKLVKDFNKKDTVVIVSPYPILKDRISKNVSGIATYTYHMAPDLSAILKKLDRKLVIICDTKPEQETTVDENGVLIWPVWERNDLKAYKNILKSLKKLDKIKNIFIHFDFNVYGEFVVSGFFPMLLFALRLKRKNVTLLLHSVAESITSLSGHLNIKSKLKMKLLDFIHKVFHILLLMITKKTIVHDQILKDRLLKLGNKPVFVIPHGLGEFKENCLALNSRGYLNFKKSYFIVLCFGFLTWYKGSDWIIDKFIQFFDKNKKSNIHLIMAGGPSANLKDQEFYRVYYNELLEKVKPYKNIQITGFVPEEKVPHYYCAADVVVLPYRTQMSASGPFAVALAFDRPFLLSKNLEGTLETQDIKAQMNILNITKDKILFDMKNNDMFKQIVRLQNNKKEKEKLANLSTQVAEIRDWSKVCKRFLMVIDA